MSKSEVSLEIAGDQIDGARDYQEDAFLTTFIDDPEGGNNATALLAMADGVGGAAAGNIASQLVTNTFNRQFSTRYGNEPVPEILRDALLKANASLAATVKETPALEGMGCTCVVAAAVRGQLFWVSVGDSHLYLVRDGELLKQNADHSYGAYLDAMERAGTPVEPDPNLRRNMLMSAMSGDEINMIDCLDGLVGAVDHVDRVAAHRAHQHVAPQRRIRLDRRASRRHGVEVRAVAVVGVVLDERTIAHEVEMAVADAGPK